MTFENTLQGKRLYKKYGKFELDIPQFNIPKGFVTALVGENGAGKSTLLSMLSGVLLDFKGEVEYFGRPDMGVDEAKLLMGYQSADDYFLPGWTIRQVYEAYSLLFPDFNEERFKEYIKNLDIPIEDSALKGKMSKMVSDLSDGNRVKLILAGLLSRDTKLLLLDEPASPLDPLMRDKLCDLIREYIDSGSGEKSVFFSTHNVADMEYVTDYLMIMEQGKIVEQGFVEELKEKYIVVKGDEVNEAAEHMVSYSRSKYGFEGLALVDEAKRLAQQTVMLETPTLTQICVGVMKSYSKVV